MSEKMSISVNGQSKVPPGFRFHPTEEELLQYYLRKKVSYEEIDLDVIKDIDLNKLEPWDIRETCKIGSTPQNDWYFFSHKDKKYTTGTRTNRATTAGFWKATGRDKLIYSKCRRIGMRKTLVFYKGRAPHGQKSDWIMHEYRLDDNTTNVSCAMREAVQEEGWVVCRVFKKKNYCKTLDSPITNSSHMGRTSMAEEQHESKHSTHFPKPISDTNTSVGLHDRFMKLTSLESPIFTQECYQPVQMLTPDNGTNSDVYNSVTNWETLANLNATQNETCKQLPSSFNDPMVVAFGYHDDLQLHSSSSSTNRPYLHTTQAQEYSSEMDLWSFTQ